jgi:glycosyltransferase involved in cell wall biosynthesis
MTKNAGDPKITVIVPTRARPDVLASSLKTVTAQDYDNLDIVVSDNLSGDTTEDVVQATGDKRVKYFNTGKRLSMAHNYEFALSQVSDGWVTIVGDDDGLMPGAAVRLAELIRETGSQAIRSATCKYRWPGVGKPYGRLRVPLKSGYEVRDSKAWLAKALAGYASFPDLPMFYTGGFVDMRIVESVRKHSGAFFRSCIPDVYSSVAFASVTESYVYCEEPLAVNGISKHSTGTSQFSNSKNQEASPAKKFLSEGNIPLHKDIPACADGNIPPSIHALIFESYLQTDFLRNGPGATSETMREQLEIILASSPAGDRDVEEWARLFAGLHGLDFEAARRKAGGRRFRFKLAAMPERLLQRMNTKVVGSPTVAVANVFDASRMAADARR